MVGVRSGVVRTVQPIRMVGAVGACKYVNTGASAEGAAPRLRFFVSFDVDGMLDLLSALQQLLKFDQ